MTREDAIHFANSLKNNYTVDLNDMEAFCDMAIKALAQEPTTKNDLGVDCISREQAKAAIRDKFKDLPSRVEINTILNDLPSVTPQEPKTGHWILDETDNSITCDRCGCLIWANDISNGEAYYCPNCGAKMESEK